MPSFKRRRVAKRTQVHMKGLLMLIFVGVLISVLTGFDFFLPVSRRSKVARGKSTVQQSQTSFYAPILTYHHINPDLKPTPYNVTPKVFAEQMDWLADNDYHVISYDDFYHATLGAAALPENPVVITFDDGYRDQYEYAVPILKSHNYSAMFYIYTHFTKAADGMNWDMLRDLVKSGMEIGGHTASHAFLPALQGKWLEYELAGSKQTLEEHLGVPIQYFAYPGGSYTQATIEALKQYGYSSAVTVLHDVIHSYYENSFTVPRIHIDNDVTSFVSSIRGEKL